MGRYQYWYEKHVPDNEETKKSPLIILQLQEQGLYVHVIDWLAVCWSLKPVDFPRSSPAPELFPPSIGRERTAMPYLLASVMC